MLRTSSECQSAILGTADTVFNRRYDFLFKEPNPFAERMARNQLLMLKHESKVGEVRNVADGAYDIASLTQQLAEKALGLFKQLEAGGGFLKQLHAHTIQKKIRESATREQTAFNNAERVLVGTNMHLHSEEKIKGAMEITPFGREKAGKTLIEPIRARRLAAVAEQKRMEDE
jgi:methylmalonyl-CoA mutase